MGSKANDQGIAVQGDPGERVAGSLAVLCVFAIGCTTLCFWAREAGQLLPWVIGAALLSLAAGLARLFLPGMLGAARNWVLPCVLLVWPALLLQIINTENAPYLPAAYPYAAGLAWLALLTYWMKAHAPEALTMHLVLAITLIALLLRVRSITLNGLWYDELLTAMCINPREPLSRVLEMSIKHNDMPPLYFIATWCWAKFAGMSELALRLFSALQGAATIPLLYLLGKRLARPGVGVIAALLLALNWLHLEWSQEARPYIALVLLTCLSFLAYLRFLESPAPGRTAALAAVNLLLVYTHHFGWLVVLAQASDALIAAGAAPRADRRRVLAGGGIALAVILAAFAPYVPAFLAGLERSTFWPPPPDTGMFIQFFRDYFNDTALALLCGGLAVYAFAGARSPLAPAQRRRTLLLLFVWLAAGTIPPLIHSANSPVSLMVNRYYLILLPAVLILAAMGVDMVRHLAGRMALLTVLVLLHVLVIFSLGDFYHRPPRGLYREVMAEVPHEGPAVLLTMDWYTGLLNYYLDRSGADLRVVGYSPETLQEAGAALADHPDFTVWVIEDLDLARADGPLVTTVLRQFMQRGRVIQRKHLTAREYVPVQEEREALAELLRSAPHTWRAKLQGRPRTPAPQPGAGARPKRQ